MPGYFTTQDTGFYMGDSRWVFYVRIETRHGIEILGFFSYFPEKNN